MTLLRIYLLTDTAPCRKMKSCDRGDPVTVVRLPRVRALV